MVLTGAICECIIPNMESTTQISAQYAAGFFDGEGSVMVERTAKQTKKWAMIDRYRVRATISNTDKQILILHQKCWGGTIEKMKKKTNHKQAWKWIVWQNQTEQFLKEILPYCFIKTTRIELALKIIDSYKGHIRGKHHPPDKEKDKQRFEWYSQIRKLNARGDTELDTCEDFITRDCPRPIEDFHRKYKSNIVEEIRRRYKLLGQPASQISKDLGVKESYVYSVATGKSRVVSEKDKESLAAISSVIRPKILKTHCSNGHKYTKTNTSIVHGWRRCKQCARDRYHKHKNMLQELGNYEGD